MSGSTDKDRRSFIKKGINILFTVTVGGLTGFLFRKSTKNDTVWQIDPAKCIQCGRCVDECVLSPSAVKCIHVHKMCGYCDLCGGYFRPDAMDLNTGAENQLCPTGAIKRTFIEDPYFKYDIDEDLCIGCGKCVKGCGSFGNGSLQLQIQQELCENCNECAIARECPSNAITRVSSTNPYKLLGG